MANYSQQNKPSNGQLAVDSIPHEMRQRKQWVMWKLVERNGKPTKEPFQPNGKPAKSNDPTTWTDFDSVVKRYQQGGFSGIGFVFGEDDPFCGIDLDGCRHPETGKVAEWAEEIIARFQTYAEISPSKTGIKLFCRGQSPFETGRKKTLKVEKVCDKEPAIEIYDRLRYFAVTGDHVQGHGTSEIDLACLEWLKRTYWPDEPTRQPGVDFHSSKAVIARAKKYLAKLPAAVSGSGGHNTTFHAACVLALGFELAEADALELMRDYNQRCEPAWSEKELLHKVHSAAQQPGQRGYLRNASPSKWNSVEVPKYTESVWGDPKPIPSGLPPVAAFDFDLLPDAFRAFVEDAAERMQCPPDFPGVAITVALAGIVGKKIGIRPKRHDNWLVVPNLWGGVVGRPGIMKTPAIRQAVNFLSRLEIEAKKSFEQERQEYEELCLVAEIKQKEKKRAIEEAIKKKLDPLEVAKRFTIEEPAEPKAKRYLVNDSTVEKLGELLNQNPTGLTVFRDELAGFLCQLEKEGQEGARAFYLEAWDGLGTFTYDRIGRGTLHIQSVTLSILGGFQPGRLLDYLGAAIKGGTGDDGLLQRFQLLVYPDVKRDWRNVDRWPDTNAKQGAWEVFQRLDGLDPERVGAQYDKEGDDSLPFLQFTPEAQRLFDDWRSRLEATVRSGEEHPALESHLAKYRSLVPSLALLIHLADNGNGPVGEGPTKKALGWATYLESHARRIYSIVTNSGAIAAKALAKRIEASDLKNGFTLRDIYRRHWSCLSERQSVEQAVDLLVDLNWLKETVEETGGKPCTHYQIHPSIFAKTAGGGSAISAKRGSEGAFGTNGTGTPGHFSAQEDGCEDESGDGMGDAFEG